MPDRYLPLTQQDDDLEDAHSYRRLRLSRPPLSSYAILDSRDAGKPEAVLSYVEDSLIKKQPPQFFLSLLFYNAKSPGENESADATLRVALPGLSYPQRSLFARSDDSPCLRGGHTSTDSSSLLAKDLRRMAGPWSVRAVGTNVGTVERTANGKRQVVRADPSSTSRWNARRVRLLAPPWRPLSEPPTQDERPLDAADAMPASSRHPWPSRTNRQVALEAVTQFCQEDKSTSRYLVCPETAYGWDMEKLQALVNDALTNDAPRNAYSRLDAFLASFAGRTSFQSANLVIEAKKAATAVRIIEGRWRRIFHMHTRRVVFELFLAISAGSAFILVLVAIGVLTGGSKWLKITFALLIALYSVYLYLMGVTCEDVGTVHEAVGVAWALLKWTQTSLTMGDAVTKEEILASHPGAVDAQLRTGIWFVQYGITEEDWWMQNAAAILTNVRAGRRGTLFLDETLTTGLEASAPTLAPPEQVPSSTSYPPTAQDVSGLPPTYNNDFGDRRDEDYYTSDSKMGIS